MLKNAAVGLDIGTSSIKLVDLQRKGDAIYLRRYGVKQIPFGSLEGGAVQSPQLVANYIKEAMAEARIKTKSAVIAVAGQTVIVRHVKFPLMEKQELANVIQYEADRHIPFPVDEACIDFAIIGADEANKEMEVMLVAAQRKVIESHIECLRLAGIQPLAIDVQPFALMRALGLLANKASGAVAILDIGAGTSDLLIYKNGCPRFTRIIPIAGSRLTQAVAGALNCSMEEAERLKCQYGDALDGSAGGDSGRVNDAIHGTLEELVLEVRRSIDYYRLQQRSDEIGQIVIAGGGAKLRNLEEFLSGELGLRVSRGNPLFMLNNAGLSEDLLDTAPILSVSIGLALREVDGLED